MASLANVASTSRVKGSIWPIVEKQGETPWPAGEGETTPPLEHGASGGACTPGPGPVQPAPVPAAPCRGRCGALPAAAGPLLAGGGSYGGAAPPGPRRTPAAGCRYGPRSRVVHVRGPRRRLGACAKPGLWPPCLWASPGCGGLLPAGWGGGRPGEGAGLGAHPGAAGTAGCLRGSQASAGAEEPAAVFLCGGTSVRPPPSSHGRVLDYHGCKISDPYCWLEDPDSEQTKAFVEAQNKLTVPFLEQCPVRGLFKERMTELYDYPKYSCHFKKGKRYFHFYNTGLQNQRVLYVQDSLDADAKVFLDPNKLSDDGTVALRGYAFSEDGEYFAYGLSSSGSDWVTIKFMKVEGPEDLPDTLERVKFSCMAWTHDGKGMFYNCYPKQDGKSDGTETSTNLHQKLHYHVLGTDQSEDILCAEFPDEPKWMGGAEVSDDGRYVLLSIREGCDPVNRLWYCDLQTESQGISGILQWVKLIDNFEAEYEYVTNEGTVFTFKTNRHSPNYRLINIDFSDPEESKWKVLVPEHERDVLEWVACVRSNFLVLCYLHDVKNILQLHDLATGAHLKTFPLEVGSIVGYSGQKKDTEIFYQFTSFLSPGIIYHCDLTKEELEPRVFREVTVKGFDPSVYQTIQVFYPSKDGTKIPMFIIHKKGIKLDGSHPAFLYGYGGFNISITPSYSVSRLIFVRHLGGVLAVANIRGGGEYGETWHKGGILANKQNCFDDFQCAAKYLIKEGYTSPKKLTINGGSNGGLLVAACANQRPDLFGCAIAQVGVMDMLKFHKYTIGHAWTTDYGCSDCKEQFEWLCKYSPLHNIKLPEEDGIQYPSTLLLTADHDDRVVPLHSLKFIATLQYVVGRSRKQTNPLLIHVDTKAGHGAGKPTAKVIEEVSDMFAFIARCLNLEWIE
ncbi:PREDICTED: prolyl endopeptidase [Calidris pugnax]|nr:PREDICTED: prolyl endopeptidase [Calidris pugnax]